MGPKSKPAKGKQPEVPEKDPEIVTQVEKEFFEFTLSDIEKKLNRINEKEEELKVGSVELEEKIEEVKKEQGVVITEHEQLLAAKEKEKLEKQIEMDQLSDEIKIRHEKYKNCMKDWEIKYDNMVEKYKEPLQKQEEEIRNLDNYKQNKEAHLNEFEELEKQIQEAEMRHERNLFAIKQNQEKAVARIKSEIQSRILRISSEFRKVSQKKIGKPYHRATTESKAIKNFLIQMQEEILEYQEKCKNSKINMIQYKNQQDKEQLEKDKTIAKTVIQLYVIKALISERDELLEKLRSFEPIVTENKNLIRKLQNVSSEVEIRSKQIEETKKNTEDKIEETKAMDNASKHLRKLSRSLQALIRSARKVAEEAVAVRLIPIGMMEGEKFLPMDGKIRLFKKRRDSVFEKKGKILQYLLDTLSKAQITENDKTLLKGSTESLCVEDIKFSTIFEREIPPEELERLEAEKEAEEERKKKGLMIFTSLTSLPRPISTAVIPERVKSEHKSQEGEIEERGEFHEEEMIRVEGGETELFDDFDLEESEFSETEATHIEL